jgi:hypothetical protein
MILDDEWLLRDLLELDWKRRWQVIGVNEVATRVIGMKHGLNIFLDYGCKWGNLWLVKFAEDQGFSDWDRGLSRACEGGHRDLVDLMIEKGANHWNWGLEGACKGGHRDLVDLMIEKGADNWNWGLGGACLRGHRDLVSLMIEKGATICVWMHYPDHEFKGGARGRDTN